MNIRRLIPCRMGGRKHSFKRWRQLFCRESSEGLTYVSRCDHCTAVTYWWETTSAGAEECVMPRYRVYAHVHGGKYLGEFEADTAEEAAEKGLESENAFVSVCHECSRQIDDPQIGEADAELIE